MEKTLHELQPKNECNTLCPKNTPDPSAQDGTKVSLGLKATLASLGKTQTAPGQGEPTGTRTTPLKHNLQAAGTGNVFSVISKSFFPRGRWGTARGKKSFWNWHSTINPWKWIWVGSLSPPGLSQGGERWNSEKNKKLRTKTIQKGWENPQSAHGGTAHFYPSTLKQELQWPHWGAALGENTSPALLICCSALIVF